MKKKITATILVLSVLASLTGCSIPEGIFGANANEEAIAEAEEGVYESVDAIAGALAACDYDVLKRNCVNEARVVKNSMPVVDKDETDKSLIVKNMIASTITYQIYDGSFETDLKGGTSSVKVIFSYANYHRVLNDCEIFVNPGDFNSRLAEVEDKINIILDLEFQQHMNEYLLVNASDLVEVYDYDDTQLKYMDSFFDMVDDIYMTGEGWDPVTESYCDTDTFECVLVLNEQASDYIWQYVYVICEESWPDWTDIYISGWITDRYPNEIHITYTHDEIFEDGYYIIIFYNDYDENMIWYEFDVYKTDVEPTGESVEDGFEEDTGT